RVVRRCELAGEGDVRGVDLQPGDPASRAHAACQQLEDPAGPAAQVGRGLSRAQARPVQERCAMTGQLRGLPPQPVTFRRAASQRVDRAPGRAAPSSPPSPDMSGLYRGLARLKLTIYL